MKQIFPHYTPEKGTPFPLGATYMHNGWNFAVHAQSKLLSCVIAPLSNPTDLRSYSLDPAIHKTGTVWHLFIPSQEPSIYYAFVDTKGHLLYDPYAKYLHAGHIFGHNRYASTQPIAVACKENPFDWESDTPPNIKRSELVIYEMHVRGFTHHASSETQYPGTYLGLIEKIDYLKDLGITAVELLPVTEFNESEVALPRCNFWGYSPLSFFAPMQRYASSDSPLEAANQFKQMVKALHKAGIEVILDLVFNHTGEGNEHGPIKSWKGFAASCYYLKNTHNHFLNYSGCGNTVNCNHPITADMIVGALRHWAVEFHIDGFRFDLASILARDQGGSIIPAPTLIERISKDPVLSHCKLIAEPWDAAGAHQVGSFYQMPWQTPHQWMEWNDDFRTVIRRFIKGTPGYAGRFATKLCGSQDLYGHGGSPLTSINYVTSHDGYTLRDLVTYQQKHNEENGEENRDGMNGNDSWNCGKEGLSTDHKISELRLRQMKNFWLALFLSAGIPMILMGDEYGHTKRGNNNTWCLDTEKNWFLWDEAQQAYEFRDFCKKIIRLRKHTPTFCRATFYQPGEVEWHGIQPGVPDWSAESQLVAFSIKDLYVAFNASPHAQKIHLPKLSDKKHWHLFVDTGHPAEQEGKQLHSLINLKSYSACILQSF